MASANRNSETTSNKASWDSDSERGTIVHAPPKKSLRVWLTEDVDPQRASASMASFCFMTGFLDAISVSASFVWCGFQTGNFIQLAIALAALFEYPAAQRYLAFPKTLQLALCSLIAFMVTATAIGRVGDVLGTHKRYWLVFGSCLSTLFTAAAAIAIWQSHSGDIASSRGNPAWTNLLTFVGIAFMSASVAVQCAQAKRLSTHFTTTIVFTIVWVDILTDRNLLNLRKRVISRDHRILAAGCLFLGTFVSRAILYKIGSAGTLGIACGLRLLIAVSWLFVPGKVEKPVDQK